MENFKPVVLSRHSLIGERFLLPLEGDQMKQLLIMLTAFASLSFGQTQTLTYTYNGLPVQVYPDSWDIVSYARINVPRNLQITNVTATVSVSFSGVGDLNVYLFSPQGTRTKLLERNCGSLV